jgi:Ca2+-binding EF-hand superfamily protein
MRRVDPAYEDMKEAFERIDKDGSGSIEFDEFMKLMRDMDHTRPESALRAQFATLDANRDGHVSLEEFQAWFGTGR